MAEALRAAGRWHAPSLEEWESIEKAIDAQEAAEEEASEERHVQPQRVGPDEEQSDGEEGGSEGEVEEAAAEGEGGGADEEHIPEKILKDRGRHPNRELLIKWKGWGSDLLDLTWQFEVGLIEDGNADLVEGWYKEQWAAGRTIKAPAGLSEAAATARAEAGLGSEEGEDSDASLQPPPPPPLQPPIHPIDMAVLLALLTAPIGSEKPNGIHSKPLKPGSSAAQREAYEHPHVTNLETGQVVHKRAALAFRQKQAKDAKPGAGHTQRYVTGERQPIVAEDSDGTGFACDEYYQLYLDENGRPLNSDAEIMIDGSLRVGYARVLEPRLLIGLSS